MKRGLLLFSILVLFAGSLLAQVGHTGLSNLPGCKAKWTTNPFDHKLFVENKGQFNNIIPSGDKVLFEAKLGSINAYFTATGVVYQYMEMLNKDTNEGTDPDAAPKKMIQHFIQLNWEGSNTNVTIDAQEEESYYYTYPAENITTIVANVFRKITYHNVYPGIDVEYVLPKDKEGIKYTLIVHPGADVGKVKLKYSGDAISSQLNKEGDVIVHSDNMADFTDHAPVSYYEHGQKLSVGYNLNGLEESFSIKGNYDKARTIIIDPWQTNPNYSGGYNKAYDLDYDNNGNIFVYGAFNPFQLVKLNSAGTILWTFNATIISGATNQWYYGDMCVDKVTGASYLTEGFNNSTGARIMKITAAGTLNALFPGNTNLIEMWRAEYDMCDDKIVIGGGGISFPSYQACVVDTTLKTLTPVNVLGVPASNCCHDIPLLAIDPSGNSCYMVSAQSITYPTIASNQILRMPLPSLSPTTYMIPDGYNFSECRSVGYVGFNNPSDQWTNAMNGMVASLNWLYLYNGDTIRRLNKATGAATKLLPLTGQPYMWGGIDVDFCENVFVGYVSAVNLYDSAMNLTGNLVLPDTVFDLHADNKGSLYACGVGYVTSISIPSSISPKLTITKTASCGCAGTATASLSLCSAPVTTTSYLWSPGGQTNQTATNLCPGTYTVKVSPSCDVFYTDSITLTGSSINPTIVGNDTICQGQNTTITATGGASYSWSNGVTSSSITVAPLKDSVYKVVVSDTSGCRDTVKVPIIVNPKPSGTVSSPQSICKGDSVHLLATGGTTYIWKPSTGLSSSTIANPSAYPKGLTTYTVFISNGKCWDTLNTSVNISVPAAIAVCCSDTIAEGSSTTLHTLPNTPGTSYAWSPTTGLSCVNCPDPTASPTQPTIYYVTITDSNGCVASDSVIIDINNCASVYIPNAFTPNGDGLNDAFYPLGGGCIQYVEMYIFNRWGAMLYHSVNKPWDGTVKERVVEEDTYVYLLIATDFTGNSTTYMGKISLVK